MYDTELCPLNKSDIRALDYVVYSALKKIFDTNSKEIRYAWFESFYVRVSMTTTMHARSVTDLSPHRRTDSFTEPSLPWWSPIQVLIIMYIMYTYRPYGGGSLASAKIVMS